MNKIETTGIGGIPIVLDDLRFLHASYLEAFKGLASPFGIAAADAIILSGVIRSIVGADVEYTEGYVAYNGEIHHFPAQTYPEPVNPENEYLVVDVTYDVEGLKVFENATSHDTYEVRKVKIVKSDTLPSGGIILADLKRFYDIIRTNIDTERSGVVKDFAGNTIPSGYLLCDGSAVSRTTYAALFSAIGTIWGVGDGSTTFNLPPAGKFSVGFDALEVDYDAVGKTGGEKEHTLIIDEMPEHTHPYWTPSGVSDTDRGTLSSTFSVDTGVAADTSAVGGDQPHENRPPYAVFKKIIRI